MRVIEGNNTINLFTISEIAKEFGFSAQKLNKLLEEAGVQCKKRGKWYICSKYSNLGYTQIVSYFSNGYDHRHLQWTSKGKSFIYNILKEKYSRVPDTSNNIRC